MDGERHPTLVANGPFVAAWLPAGERAVELLYRPRGLVAGALLAAGALAAALVLWLPRPGKDSKDNKDSKDPKKPLVLAVLIVLTVLVVLF